MNGLGPHISNTGGIMGGVFEVTGSLSSAQIHTLHSSPVQILPPPFPGVVYIPDTLEVEYLAGSIGYTGAGVNIQVSWFVGGLTVSMFSNIGVASLLLISQLYLRTRSDNQVPLSSLIGASVVFFATGVPAAGNGTFNYRLRYRLMPIP